MVRKRLTSAFILLNNIFLKSIKINQHYLFIFIMLHIKMNQSLTSNLFFLK